MANQIKIGRFESDNGLVNIPIGFLPDVVFLFADGGSTGNMVQYTWFKLMEDIDSLEGFKKDDNTDSELGAGSGISAYNSSSEAPTVLEWSESVAEDATARGVGVRGTLCKATVSGVDDLGNRMDRSAIFECVVDGTGNANEPPWPRVVGERVTELGGDTTVWERVDDVALRRAGYQGFTLAGAMTGLADGNIGYFIAIASGGNVIDFGDVDGWASGVLEG